MNTRLMRFALLVVLVSAAMCVAQTSSKGTQKRSGTQPVITLKPDPAWPKSIQKIDCTIILRAIFRANGLVTNIYFVEVKPEKPKGLSEEDIDDLVRRTKDAAKQITFKPATKDGTPVSMWMELQYHFNRKP